MSRQADLLSAEETQRVEEAVAEAEGGTSAEIKLAVVRHCWVTIEEKAAALFEKLRLFDTAERNCVLILLVTANREFLIHGDEGIHAKVGQGFWDGVRDAMLEHFRKGDVAGGLCEGIRSIGRALSEHFPHREDDVNEIPDDVAAED